MSDELDPLITHHSSLITAIVVARDEERFIAGCLESLSWADARLVVVDSRGQDGTAAIARRFTAQVNIQPFESFARFRNRALALAPTPWVLFVDADERVPAALAAAVRAAVGRSAVDGTVGYWVPRRNWICGRWMRGAGWWPDYQLRLLRRDAARYDPAALVHEVAALDGAAGWLTQPLVHYNYHSLAEFVAKQRRYAGLEARAAWHAGAPSPRARAAFGQPLREFWRRYVSLGGWQDGALGLILATYMGYAAWLRTRLLRRLWRVRGAGRSAEGNTKSSAPVA